MRTLLAIAAALALAGADATLSSASPASTVTLRAASSSYGRILFDGRGFALYGFTRDRPRTSRCYGDCAKAWPVYYAKGKLRAGAGVKQSLLGTTRRKDGRLQVTYAGRPLYYYEGDTKRGQVSCQNVDEFGGTWLVVRPNGRLVR